jgi:tetratricopeptide (TPR) repeat protein
VAEYYDLGIYRRQITTGSSIAGEWFNRGLNWCFGFHHEEAIVCFENALKEDPVCSMAHWGIAYAIGPNYNKPWEAFDEEDKRCSLDLALDEAGRARDNLDGCTPVEVALIGALSSRFPTRTEKEDFSPWNDAYADAMREVYREFPDDLDVCTLFAEAMMNRTPWALWNLETGKPEDGADTLEAIEVLETAFRDLAKNGANEHPGLLHLYIHLMEMSSHPEKALKAGDRLLDLVPDAGHLLHMPTHVDVLCGHYHNVVERNSRAIIADRKYLKSNQNYTLIRVEEGKCIFRGEPD